MAEKQGEHKKLKQTAKNKRVGPPYSAITLDTCIYQQHQYKFDGGLLDTVAKLRVPFVVSEIVSLEVVDHLCKDKEKTLNTIRSAINIAEKSNLLNNDKKQQLSVALKETVENISAKEKWNDFLDGFIDIKVIHSEFCDVQDMVGAYFKSTPPFNKTNKKNEFPDAIALLSLEKWAEKNNKKILAISSDNDWLNFSEQSNYIDVISDLKTGLVQIQPSIYKTKEWIYKFISQINTEEYQDIKDEIEVLLAEEVALCPSEINEDETYSNLGAIKGYILAIEYQPYSLSFSTDESELELDFLVNTFSDTTFAIEGKISVSAEANITHYEKAYHDFFAVDETHDDYHHFHQIDGHQVEVKDVQIPIKIIFSLKGDVTLVGYAPSVSKISILDQLYIPFDEISLPDFKR